MNKLIGLMIVIVISSCMSGCLSAYKTIRHNDKIQQARQMVEVKTTQNWDNSWEVRAGVDLLSLSKMEEGYLGAWKADPAGMTWATAIDAVVVAGAGYLLKEQTDNKTKISEVEQPATYEINANTVIVNRDGTVNYSNIGAE